MRPLKADPFKDPTLDFEREWFAIGHTPTIIGIDEAGRGAIAGPVAVGAHVVAPNHTVFPQGLRDSKLLSEARREYLLPHIEAWGRGAVGFRSASDIDKNGITAMLGEAARDALLQLHTSGVDVESSLIILDGSHDWLSPVLTSTLRVVVKSGADRLHASVAAASLRAKVYRDRLMVEAHQAHPHYGWVSNKGYGARVHYDGIRQYGLTHLHRRTWISA